MKISKTARLWAHLPLVARLTISASFALLLAGMVMLYSSVRSESLWHQDKLAQQAKNTLNYLAPALNEQVVIGDFSTMEQMLQVHTRQEDIQLLRYDSHKGGSIQSISQKQPELRAPAWFSHFTRLQSESDSLEIKVGGMPYGLLSISLSPNPAINRCWDNFINHLVILFLAIALDFFGIVLILKNGMRPLDALRRGANRLGSGELAARIPLKGSPEMRSVTLAFNTMADNIQSLVALVHHEKELAQVTLQSIGDAVITTDQKARVTYLNPVAEALTGWCNSNAKGKHIASVFHIINEYTREPASCPVQQVLKEGMIIGLSNHTVLISKAGQEYAIEDSAAPIWDLNKQILGAVLVFHDVTERRLLAHRLSHQARHDALTGLFNRAEFERELSNLLDSALRKNEQHALLYLDLDQFKLINDTCGHSAGDELLRELTLLMQNRVRETDIFARLGGDEFGILLEHCPLDQAIRVANALLEEIRAFRFEWEGQTFTVGMSIGLIELNEHSGNAATVLAAADTACFAAKDSGRNRVQVYSPDDSEIAERHGEMHWVARINRAFEEERFVLYYQPIIPASGQQDDAQHFEILLRMLDEVHKPIAPGLFIPAAERYNMMLEIDRWVIGKALGWLNTQAEKNLLCSINLSGQSINDERFLAFLVEAIQQSGVAPHKICFEVTETAAISNLAKASSFIKTIKSLGCHFSLDDFGSGMSSFAYLKNLPVDYLKIDGSFVSDMLHDPIDLAMVESINHIGHVMGIKTVAEFVENEEILAKLRSIGVDYAQGYTIAKPAPLADMA